MELQVVETKRGKPSLLHCGHRYTAKRKNKNSVLWTCANRSCHGTITTCKDFKLLEIKTSHSCAPNEAKNEVDVCLYNAKKRARDELTPIPQIYRQELMSARDAGLDFVVEIPNFSSVKGRFYRERHRALGVDVLPKKRAEIVIPETTLPYLVIDDGDDERILVFASNRGHIFKQKSEIFMDGTFKSCCSLFDQLYTIHVDLGSNMSTTCVVPAIYALLPNRKEVTYRRLFKLLQERYPTFLPKIVHIDFERAAINAIKCVFPEVSVKGCNFHFNQALWRKVQELGLTTIYRENSEVRDHIRMCAALAHLPEEVTTDAWLHIMESVPDEEALVLFNDYFVEQWLESDRIWICYNERHRTTNAVEGWHTRLNNRVGKVHPNIFELMKIIVEEIDYYDILEQRCELGLATPKRAKKYIDVDNRIKQILQDFLENNIDLGQTLRRLIYIVHFC